MEQSGVVNRRSHIVEILQRLANHKCSHVNPLADGEHITRVYFDVKGLARGTPC